ncbi:MAG: GyrI-like domain-containing protein [Clostridiales bacterium]|nr:GyrI-like domain-containing protein [Clostridiales bacterium]
MAIILNTNHKSKHTDIPKHWNNYHKKYKSKLQKYDYGLLKIHNDNSYSYWIGRESSKANKLLIIPAGWYLKFDTPLADAFTFVESIHQAWEEIYRYIKENNITQKGPFAFERYIEASRTFSEEIFIPVEGEKI